MGDKIFIPGNVPSLKNSKRIIGIGARCKSCGHSPRRIMISSKSIETWKKDTAKYWKQYREEFLEMLSASEAPHRIAFRFIRRTRHRFDYTNAADTICDELVHQGWIEDDNSDILRPVFRPYRYDKHNPGVFIDVIT